MSYKMACPGCREPYAEAEAEEVHEVESIASHRPDGESYEFNVFWAGYAAPTWERVETLAHIDVFHAYIQRVTFEAAARGETRDGGSELQGYIAI